MLLSASWEEGEEGQRDGAALLQPPELGWSEQPLRADALPH